jgi:DNA repair photolyase
LDSKNPLAELERNLQRLSRQGVLRTATIYFGVTTDPFFPFEAKFDASMRFLELFRKYTPGMLVVQTRSPLIVIALPVFKKLGAHACVSIGIETPLEESVRRYTPGLPRVSERLKTATALRRFGIQVNLQVSPVLPYGDWRNDASKFAELLAEHGDHVYVKSVTDGSDIIERKIRSTALAVNLARDRKFHWLRPDSANPLITALEAIAPEKLKAPERKHMQERQVRMFAA